MIGKLFAAEKRSHEWTPQRRQQLRAQYSTTAAVRHGCNHAEQGV